MILSRIDVIQNIDWFITNYFDKEIILKIQKPFITNPLLLFFETTLALIDTFHISYQDNKLSFLSLSKCHINLSSLSFSIVIMVYSCFTYIKPK